MLKISIITINYNSSISVLRTIKSVLSQSYNLIEWIVIDGGSNDESLAILERYKKNFDVYISEGDRGISHAMNKGLFHCTGDVVLYLNAGDALSTPTVLSEVIEDWDYERYKWITGAACVCDSYGKRLYFRTHKKKDLANLLMSGCRIFHASTLVSRALLNKIGGFSEVFKSSMDYDLWLRLARENHLPQITDIVISDFFVGGTSSNLFRRYREDKKSRLANGYSSVLKEIRLYFIVAVKGAFSRLKRFSLVYKIKEWMHL